MLLFRLNLITKGFMDVTLRQRILWRMISTAAGPSGVESPIGTCAYNASMVSCLRVEIPYYSSNESRNMRLLPSAQRLENGGWVPGPVRTGTAIGPVHYLYFL